MDRSAEDGHQPRSLEGKWFIGIEAEAVSGNPPAAANNAATQVWSRLSFSLAVPQVVRWRPGSSHHRFFVPGGTAFAFTYFQKRKAAGIAKNRKFRAVPGFFSIPRAISLP